MEKQHITLKATINNAEFRLTTNLNVIKSIL